MTTKKKWCGTRKPKNAITASYRIKLKDVITNKDDYDFFGKFFIQAETNYHTITSNPIIKEQAPRLAAEFGKGNFYTHLGNILGKPWRTSDRKCNNAWYWHNDAELIRRNAQSYNERHAIETIVAQHDWDASQAKNIQLVIHDKLKKWHTLDYIKQVCVQHAYSPYTPDTPYKLDYGTQSKCTTSENDWVPDHPKQTVTQTIIAADEHERRKITLKWKIPDRVILNSIDIIHVCKPSFYHDPDYYSKDEIVDPWNDIVMSVPYWFVPKHLDLGKGILGVDLGLLRVFRAGAVFPDSSYAENLDPSLETETLNNHVRILQEQKRCLYAKVKRIERLVRHSQVPDPSLVLKLSCLRDEYSATRSAIACARESLGWLVARDVCCLAREFGCHEIHLENLRWVGGHGQSWDVRRLRDCVRMVAARFGIRVMLVSAFRSSHTDPSTGQPFLRDVDDSRVAVEADCSVHDRDGEAGKELACRSHGKDFNAGRLFARRKVERPFGRSPERHRSGCSRGRDASCDAGFRPCPSFGVSLSGRRAEFLSWLGERRATGEDLFDGLIFSFVGRSRSVACLCRCRSVASLLADGVPGGTIDDNPERGLNCDDANLANSCKIPSFIAI